MQQIAWVLAGALVGCIAVPKAASTPNAEGSSTASASSASAAPLAAPVCTLPKHVTLATRNGRVLLNGEDIAAMVHLPWSTHPPTLKHTLVACRDERRSYELDLDVDGAAADTRALLAEVPAERDHLVSLVFDKSEPVSIRQRTLKRPSNHWVLLRVQRDHILVRELVRKSASEEEPSVATERTVSNLLEGYAWLRNVCIKEPCIGVILSLPPDQKNSTIQGALEAIRAPNTPPPLLDLHDAENESNELTWSGRLPPEEIQQVVRDSYGAFRKCYEYGLARNPKLEGGMSIRFVIDLDGSVRKSTQASSTLADDEVARCAVNLMATLHFPEPDGGIVTVIYPIMFSPGPQPAPAATP